VYTLLTKALPFHPPGTAGAAVLVAEGAIIVLLTLLRPQGVFGSRRRGVPVGMARTAG
jgi:ABC-type branched-subunit amino acid transport system permease subunit